MIYLALLPPTRKSSPGSMYVGGDIQWKGMGELATNNELRLRFLLSYYYYKDINIRQTLEQYFTKPYPDVFADSGGFSASTQNEEISLDDYAKWILLNKESISAYANLDVIGNPVKTLENQKRLEDYGLNPLPVFHVGEDWKYLEKYLENYNYICLGGMVPHMRYENRIMPWILKCYRIAQGRSVFHGFGATSWKVIRDIPWYSVDSSSWGAGFRFGNVPVFDYEKGKLLTLTLGEIRQWARHAPLVSEMGFDYKDFGIRENNDRAKICALSAMSYVFMERYLRARHGEIRISDREPGAKIYLSDIAGLKENTNLGMADSGVKIHLAAVKSDLVNITKGLKK